jgi:hypothetical protein
MHQVKSSFGMEEAEKKADCLSAFFYYFSMLF